MREGKADASGMSLIISSRWLEGVHVMPNMQRRDLVFMVNHPEPKDNYAKLTGPFDLMTWILLIATTIGVCNFLAISINMSKFFTNGLSTSEGLLVGFAIMIGQSLSRKQIGFNSATNHNSVLIIIWMFTSYLIILAYKSDLLASLCRQDLEEPIDTYQDVLDRNFRAYVPLGTMTGHLLKTSPNPFVRYFYNEAVSEVSFVKGKYSQEVLDEMYAGKAVINVIYESSLETPGRVVKHILVGGNLQCGYYHRKNDFTMERVKTILDKFVDAGVKAKIVNRYIWKMSRKERNRLRNEDPVNRSEPLTISHFLPLFAFYGILIVMVAAIAFV